MISQAESSKLSVNERLARAREEDLRRCRNLQSKLARVQSQGLARNDSGLDTVPAPTASHRGLLSTNSTSSRVGLMYLSSTELAQRERDQRSRERQLKRQVAGPIPPESWREEFDRLSMRRGIALQSDVQRYKHLNSPRHGQQLNKEQHVDNTARRRTRTQHQRICSGLRHFCDPLHSGADESSRFAPSLLDMALCVIADTINHRGVDRTTPEMDRTQIREVLEFLPRHMQQRMLSLCGRLAATDWPLAKWTAQVLVDLEGPKLAGSDHENHIRDDNDNDDWDAESSPDLTILGATDSHKDTDVDLSFSILSVRTIHRMLGTSKDQTSISLRMLSLAGWNTSEGSTTPLDSPSMQSMFAQLPNLQILSLAGSQLSRSLSDTDGGLDHQRAAVFLRKLSRSLPRLRMLDLSFCPWVSADAILGVSWATPTTVAWPRLKSLLLVGCESVVDPRENASSEVSSTNESCRFMGKAAGNHAAPWHATHSQRAMAMSASRSTDQAQPVNGPPGTLHDAYADTLHRDPFDVVPNPTTQRQSNRATFTDYVSDTVRPAIISHMTPSSTSSQGVLMEFVRCPRSAGKVEMWQWQRARILDALRGRTHTGARSRTWIEVYF